MEVCSSEPRSALVIPQTGTSDRRPENAGALVQLDLGRSALPWKRRGAAVELPAAEGAQASVAAGADGGRRLPEWPAVAGPAREITSCTSTTV